MFLSPTVGPVASIYARIWSVEAFSISWKEAKLSLQLWFRRRPMRASLKRHILPDSSSSRKPPRYQTTALPHNLGSFSTASVRRWQDCHANESQDLAAHGSTPAHLQRFHKRGLEYSNDEEERWRSRTSGAPIVFHENRFLYISWSLSLRLIELPHITMVIGLCSKRYSATVLEAKYSLWIGGESRTITTSWHNPTSTEDLSSSSNKDQGTCRNHRLNHRLNHVMW